MDEFTKYYLEQAGGGAGASGSADLAVGETYAAGFRRGQKGRGVGDFFKGVWSFVSPLFKSGASALGKQALRTGADILTEAAAAGPSADIGGIAKQRLVEARDKMTTKMRGAGRRGVKRRRTPCTKKTKKRKVSRPRKQKKASRTKLDIFSTLSPKAYKRK